MDRIDDAHRQPSYGVGLEWGAAGADALGPGCHVAVVVDVLSFTTTLTVAADRGITVYPYRWRDAAAATYAAERGAVLAVGRSRARPGEISLSPASVRTARPSPSRLVLPSPNGSTISARLASGSTEVIGVCLRNRQAAAEWLCRRRRTDPALRVAVIAAGERWPGGALRPAVEDQWGAGALIEALVARGWDDLSPEARSAVGTFDAVAGDLGRALRHCASGRELVDLGYQDDVRTAAELDHSESVPLLSGEAFLAS
ncbi:MULTISPECIES: 2-phosphosulfolactate phosphatase [unclassified Pseudonocardia]|uniref:2-phosphosulfolactate phosphatase n=1 Tax=unclassified Pseudonocardia TaxID=2619320 RepID=UPI0001FFEDF5|nr:2-phosphosulfolactate phosphatase [Pseudonocardia sp. Ae707_Ps1]OLM20336.1 putative 2-phosphosulfolactate phosphatase [Pseudonocardia sp. Ae707_Ps1]